MNGPAQEAPTASHAQLASPGQASHNGSIQSTDSDLQTSFPYPVDVEHKALQLHICSWARPHMRAFHVSWIVLFSAFASTFAPAALLPVIREDLDLTSEDIGNAGIASVCGSVVARVTMGVFVDHLGPRYGVAIFATFTSSAVFCMALIETAGSFVACRLLVGFSLATFVPCQFWCTNMFNARIVGQANAVAAGWGNLGGGATLLLMPLLVEAFSLAAPVFHAWRWAFFIPAAVQLAAVALVVTASDDLPDGKFTLVKVNGQRDRPKGWGMYRCVLFNYRAWILVIMYGLSFGVELTVDNVIVQYLYDHFDVNLTIAGALGALFGLMNLFTRAGGGYASDWLAHRYGMRGRLWALYVSQTAAGIFCCLMGVSGHSLVATIALMVVFSVFVQAACGCTFGVVPFVSNRSIGLLTGLIAAGGNAFSGATQSLFFAHTDLESDKGFLWMGVLMVGALQLLLLLRFPAWGGMISGATPGAVEESYYMSEYSIAERAAGVHLSALKFAHESRSQRTAAAAAAAVEMQCKV